MPLMNPFEPNRQLRRFGLTASWSLTALPRSWLIGILTGGVLTGLMALPAPSSAADVTAQAPGAGVSRKMSRHGHRAAAREAAKATHGVRAAVPRRHHHVVAVRHAQPSAAHSTHDAAAQRIGEFGIASWYGGRRDSRQTASGVRLDDTHLTAAHPFLPMHSRVRVTNLDNGRSVTVRVTDRGPHKKGRIIDLSPSAAAQLDMMQAGLAHVRVEPIASLPPDHPGDD